MIFFTVAILGVGILLFVNSNNTSSTAECLYMDSGICYDASANDLKVAHNIISGTGSGGVALTINDGYGNANLTFNHTNGCLLYTSPSPRDLSTSRMPSSA